MAYLVYVYDRNFKTEGGERKEIGKLMWTVNSAIAAKDISERVSRIYYKVEVIDSTTGEVVVFSDSEDPTVMRYKGSLADKAALLSVSTAKVGDVYNVVLAIGKFPAGTNWACKQVVTEATTEENYLEYWSPLGGSFELSVDEEPSATSENPLSNKATTEYFLQKSEYAPTDPDGTSIVNDATGKLAVSYGGGYVEHGSSQTLYTGTFTGGMGESRYADNVRFVPGSTVTISCHWIFYAVSTIVGAEFDVSATRTIGDDGLWSGTISKEASMRKGDIFVENGRIRLYGGASISTASYKAILTVKGTKSVRCIDATVIPYNTTQFMYSGGRVALSPNGVTATNLASDSVVAAKIASNAVTTVKIADKNVTSAKLADASVTKAKLAAALLTTEVRDTEAATDDAIPTEKAVRAAIEAGGGGGGGSVVEVMPKASQGVHIANIVVDGVTTPLMSGSYVEVSEHGAFTSESEFTGTLTNDEWTAIKSVYGARITMQVDSETTVMLQVTSLLSVNDAEYYGIAVAPSISGGGARVWGVSFSEGKFEGAIIDMGSSVAVSPSQIDGVKVGTVNVDGVDYELYSGSYATVSGYATFSTDLDGFKGDISTDEYNAIKEARSARYGIVYITEVGSESYSVQTTGMALIDGKLYGLSLLPPIGSLTEKTLWAVEVSSDKISGTRIELGGGEAVTSVAGKTGDVILDKSDVGLSNVDNTSDADKPISTATQSALDLKADKSEISDMLTKTEAASTYQPKGDYALKSDIASVYKVKGSCTYANLPSSPSQGDVWNITDSATLPAGSNVVWTGSEWDKLSETVDLSVYATTEALGSLAAVVSSKVDKVEGKGLSTNDYTAEEKTKLEGIEAGAQVNPTALSELSDDETHRLVTDEEKTSWDSKADVTSVSAEGSFTATGDSFSGTLTDDEWADIQHTLAARVSIKLPDIAGGGSVVAQVTNLLLAPTSATDVVLCGMSTSPTFDGSGGTLVWTTKFTSGGYQGTLYTVSSVSEGATAAASPSADDNSTKLATTAWVRTLISSLDGDGGSY